MRAKDFLNQAYRLDHRINSKLEQVASLNQLATKCTSTISGMPGGSSKSSSTIADAVVKIVDLKDEINADIDKLVNLKRQIVDAIKSVNDTEYQTLLELRYLCFYSWEQIAADMNYSIQHTFRIHSRAMKEIEKFLKDESK